ncbi:orotate phosphoribosyltransferase [Lentinus tigrinus ALCF2SS1-7]|uniref:orotate phosphoribosyltransferase n=1 Tax=Lentinus tigrinus ALCF2SS1-6 TaxID=1328759 RepID=A0A5C2S0Z3_9APHY|nr:orotate phosphoribosyltransferase [Lentinus tigrinus ALCF2SS1-6]RPD71702.1 orotate phosphoribosyltransferase [Lentinus tigrinus ALCF2SS1-7]
MSLQKYQTELIEHSLSAGALMFGTFTLKSGRLSPYFFNAGLLASGPVLDTLCSAYAATIASALKASPGLPEFDVLFGPAYKGIPFAAGTALLLHREHKIDVGFAYDRKEAKDHGEGGVTVGTPVKGKRVVILDDVATAGTAIRGAIDIVRREGGEVVGAVLLLDRQELGKAGRSTIAEVEELLGGKGRVPTILTMQNLMSWLQENGRTEELEKMKAYYEEFGAKDAA